MSLIQLNTKILCHMSIIPLHFSYTFTASLCLPLKLLVVAASHMTNLPVCTCVGVKIDDYNHLQL